jgi:polysaccharide export outer membrane protein
MEGMLRRSGFWRLPTVIVVLGLLWSWPVVTGLPAASAETAAAMSADDAGVYRVQVAAGFSARRAKRTKRKIEKDDKFKDHKILIQYSAKSGVYRVEVGEFATAAEAEVLAAELLEAGFKDADVVRDHRYTTGPADEPDPVPVKAAVEPAATSPPPAVEPAPEAEARPDKPVAGTAAAAPQRTDFIIGPEDLLEISVFELEGLNKTVRVSEEGMINLPLLGEVQAEGRTRRGLEETVRALLEEKYINNPQVSVFIREYRSQSVSVIGSVQKPGSYKLLGARTLIHMISEAGGLTDKAGPDLYLIRIGADGQSSRITVDIEDLMVEGLPEANLLVQAGDVINIPVDPQLNVYIYGAVRSPGELSFKKSDVISLLQAITKAGGLTDRAAADRVRIKRVNRSGVEEQIDVNLKKILKGKQEDLQLQDKDVVVVPETIF